MLCEHDIDGLLDVSRNLFELLLTVNKGQTILGEKLSSHPIDKISMTLLPSNAIENCAPGEIPTSLVSKSDGNCLYNSASILIVGNEHLAPLLRALVSIELFTQKEYYASHPYLQEKERVTPGRSLFEFFLKSVSTEKASHEVAITREAISNCHPREWCSMVCLFALSSVLKCPIKSIYPNTSTIYSTLFNGIIQPRATLLPEPMIYETHIVD